MGYTNTREHNSWRAMKERCYRERSKSFANYGGRGISVGKKWRDDFTAFYADMGPCPRGYTLDRIDNEGDYTPINCRWATLSQQARNKRNWVRLLTHKGRTQHLVDWAKELGIGAPALHARIAKYGWTLEQALSSGKSHKWSRRPRVI